MNLQQVLNLEPGDRCVVVFRGAPIGVDQNTGLRVNMMKATFRSFHYDEKTPQNSVVVVQTGSGETADIAFPITDIYLGRVSSVATVATIVKPLR